MEVLAVVAAAVFGLGIGFVIHVNLTDARREAYHGPAPLPPPPPPVVVDNTALIVETLSKAISETAAAIGKAVQAAQYMPEPVQPPAPKGWVLDPDVREGIVDSTDPTDMEGWLKQTRDDVAFLDHGESPIPGVEMRP